MNYMKALEDLGDKIKEKTGVEFHTVAYSGGVPGGTSKEKLPFQKYDYYKSVLCKLFGEPEVREPWHPNHTKGTPPLRWKIADKMEVNKLYHVQLISMMQRPNARYLIISYM